MESVKIEKLLDAYFEGTTTLAEEKLLRDYFNSNSVAGHLDQYSPIFEGFEAAKEERSSRKFIVPGNKSKTKKRWLYSVAAIFVISIGIGSLYFSQPHYSQEEKEALAAFEQSKKAMMLLSENLNKGAEQLTFVNQFEITKDKIFE